MIVTQWFICADRPLHKGWYEIMFDGDIRSSKRWWDGQHWRYTSIESSGISRFGWPGDKWRGLAVKP